MEIGEFHAWVEARLIEISHALPEEFELTLVGRDITATTPGSGFIMSNDDYDMVIRELEAGKGAEGRMVVDYREPNS